MQQNSHNVIYKAYQKTPIVLYPLIKNNIHYEISVVTWPFPWATFELSWASNRNTGWAKNYFCGDMNTFLEKRSSYAKNKYNLFYHKFDAK